MALAQRHLVNEYAELKYRIKQQGLLEQQPVYYTYKILFTLALLALSIACLIVFKHSWLQLLNAIILAFVFGQIGFIGHDSGHRQIFRSTRLFKLAGFVTGNLLLGWSLGWLVAKHNRHHGHPHTAEWDPGHSIPLLAFTHSD